MVKKYSFAERENRRRLARAEERAPEYGVNQHLPPMVKRGQAQRRKSLAAILRRQRAVRRAEERAFLELPPEERGRIHFERGRTVVGPKQKKDEAWAKAQEIVRTLRWYFKADPAKRKLPAKAISHELFSAWMKHSPEPLPYTSKSTFHKKVVIALRKVNPKHRKGK